MKSFYWHDYETWGINPAVDRPSQFAGVRTDEDLNIIGDPLIVYCKPPEDILPNPEACLVTGISPQLALEKGLPENEFVKAIYRELARPKTCSVGYNSIRFDDEVTRYSLYRNYYDPYEREWRNGNSRWDIIDMVRLCYALRPEGIEWPMVEGKPSFKLENLTVANGIAHADAHDAYSDVAATIEMARLVRAKQPALYDYVLKNKSKAAAAKLIDLKNRKPLFHISSKFPSENGCAGLIVPLAGHPTNKNAVIVYNLSVDPAPLAALSADEISERIFTAQSDLPEGVERLPIKMVHLNKCPVLAIPKILDEVAAKRLKIDKAQCEENWQKILRMDLVGKLQTVFSNNNFAGDDDPETQLYDGFIGDRDKALMQELRNASVSELSSRTFIFEDARLNAMLLRFRARNHPQSLSEGEKKEWHEFVRERLLSGGKGRLSFADLQGKITQYLAENTANPGKCRVLNELRAYCSDLAGKYSLT